MARPYRLQGEGLLYHITSRGDDRKKIFISDVDRLKFFEYLLAAKEKFDFYLYAYCLMGNHYHLLLETTQPNLSRIMQFINTAYTVYYNKKRNKCGHLFQGRYKSLLVDGDTYLLELTRYIHLNPVRAKIVDIPEQYRWSSYNQYLGRAKDMIIDIAELENRYLKINKSHYKHFVQAGIGQKVDFFSQAYAGFILGGKQFVDDALEKLKIQIGFDDLSHKKALTQNSDPAIIINAVSRYYKIDSELLKASFKKPLLARKVAVYLLKKHTSLTNKQIGDEFKISYSAVSKVDKGMQRIIAKERRVKNDVDKIISHFKV